jgi:hypothetical protein
LSLPGLTALDDSLVPLLPRVLQFLDLRNVHVGITDASLLYLPPALVHLGLRSNKTLTPEAFFAIRLHYLKYLDLRKNPHFTKHKVLLLAPPLLAFKTKKLTRESSGDYYPEPSQLLATVFLTDI